MKSMGRSITLAWAGITMYDRSLSLAESPAVLQVRNNPPIDAPRPLVTLSNHVRPVHVLLRVFNRASPSAYLRGHRQSTFHTLHWLRHLERIGIPVVNGSKVYSFELSKASQLDLLEELGLPYPRARVINHSSLAVAAAAQLRYPVLVKANIGGSGAGIVRYENEVALGGAVARREVELGVDGVALVQEAAPLRNGHIVRVETLGGDYLYAIKVFPAVGSFDLCP